MYYYYVLLWFMSNPTNILRNFRERAVPALPAAWRASPARIPAAARHPRRSPPLASAESSLKWRMKSDEWYVDGSKPMKYLNTH